MRQLIFLFLGIAFLFSACTKNEITTTSPDEKEISTIDLAHDFRQVGFNYSHHEGNIQYVNETNGVKLINDEPGMNGEHWVYQSPSLQDVEIGFSVVYSDACKDTPCDVVLFLHGSKGNENAGSVIFYDYYKNNKSDMPRAFIFANGIYAPESDIPSGVWKIRTLGDRVFNHQKQLLELIGAISDGETLFPMMKKDMESWSTIGFSAGGSASAGVCLDPIFLKNPQFQPKHNFPFGGWMTESLNYYCAADEGLELVNTCGNTDVDLVIANHIVDDVNCSGYTTYERRSWLTNRLTEKNIPYTFLGLTDYSLPCEMGDDHNPAHSVSFYLRNLISTSEKEMHCGDVDDLNELVQVGDILF